MKDYIVIGAGICGLRVASELKGSGKTVLVLDKARGPGGRMSTRRLANGRADHGAQYFSARTEPFKVFVNELLEEQIICQWFEHRRNADGSLDDVAYPRYVAAEGMNAVTKYLARGLEVSYQQRVSSIAKENDTWVLECESGEGFQARSLVLTAPVPQSLELLQSSNISLDQESRIALEGIHYHKCIAVMFALDGPSNIPEPGGMLMDGMLSWVADNRQKGVSKDFTTVTAHLSTESSEKFFDEDLTTVGEQVKKEIAELLGSAVTEMQVHRWRYSQPKSFFGKPFLHVSQDPHLFLCGDAFVGPRIEGAFLSAHGLIEHLRD